MQTLEQLKAGELLGTQKLTLGCGLYTFPEEIFDLAKSLEYLDLSNNKLSNLPDDFGKLKKLKILFLSNNQFKELPSVLAQCPKLSMLGIRNNQITHFPENALPLNLRWLILTENAIKTLPDSIGDLKYLQKLMLSGNQIKSLPKTLLKCKNLELLRLSANQLDSLPPWLLTLPKLSWFAYSANPFCAKHPSCDVPLREIDWSELELKEVLGEGASGRISKAIYNDKKVAIKVFKGEMTSDGLPKEEMDINISLGEHKHLIDVLARVTNHPQGNNVLMLELIPADFFNLGLPPTLESCTRDVYVEGLAFSVTTAVEILKEMASAGVHLHEHGIMHGDFYAHNIMINSKGESILGDFGASSYYEPNDLNMRDALERLEVRAFGCLVEELLLLSQGDLSFPKQTNALNDLKKRCLAKSTSARPLFKSIYQELGELSSELNSD